MRLSKREKNIIIFAGIFFIIFLIAELLVVPFVNYKKQISLNVVKKERDIIEMAELVSEYNKLTTDTQKLEALISKKEKSFSLFTFLENISGKTELKGNIKYMKPSESKVSGTFKESMVEMELDNIKYEQLLKFMYEIEYSDMGISLKRISIKKKQVGSGMLDVILQIVSYDKIGQ